MLWKVSYLGSSLCGESKKEGAWYSLKCIPGTACAVVPCWPSLSLIFTVPSATESRLRWTDVGCWVMNVIASEKVQESRHFTEQWRGVSAAVCGYVEKSSAKKGQHRDETLSAMKMLFFCIVGASESNPVNEGFTWCVSIWPLVIEVWS